MPDEGNREFKYKTKVLNTMREMWDRNGHAHIKHTDLLRGSRLDSEQFVRAIKSLSDEGIVTTVKRSQRGGTVSYYALNEAVSVSDLVYSYS